MKKLSREEMKLIKGSAKSLTADNGPECKSGSSCKVVKISANGTKNESYGSCSMTTSGTTVACYCSAWDGSTITSNNGMSNCWV